MLSHRALTLSLGLLGATLGATVSFDAWAHTRLVSPAPRSSDDGLKDGNGGAPCGAIAPTGKPTVLKAGEPVSLAFEETVNHPGCFLVALLENGDTKQTLLANVKHVADGGTPRAYAASVDLPKGLTCDGCTLQLRQMMLADDQTTCPPATIAPGTTYYSCADVRITVEGPVDAGASADAGGGGGSGGDGDAGTAPDPAGDVDAGTAARIADAGARSALDVPGSEVMSCSASPVGTEGGANAAAATGLLLGAAALITRRRRSAR
jgi:hypothetical protein